MTNKIEYICRDCLVAPTCTKICGKFTDSAVDMLFDPPTESELPTLYKELKKHKRCIVCRKNNIVIEIYTYSNDTDNKTIHATCDFCDTLYVIKQNSGGDYLDDVYWEFHDHMLKSLFTFNKLFKDLGIIT